MQVKLTNTVLMGYASEHKKTMFRTSTIWTGMGQLSFVSSLWTHKYECSSLETGSITIP
jgi:hypothetical protein